MSKSHNAPKDRWDELGVLLEELYSKAHSMNDHFAADRLDWAIAESSGLEDQVVKVLELYHEIDGNNVS